MMNSVHSLPTILPTDITVGINFVGNSVGKIIMSSFFLLCFNYFVSHCNSLGIYRGNIVVGKIRRYISDENIPLVFSFVFVNFLVMFVLFLKKFKSKYRNLPGSYIGFM
jgi:hypothetical protein